MFKRAKRGWAFSEIAKPAEGLPGHTATSNYGWQTRISWFMFFIFLLPNRCHILGMGDTVDNLQEERVHCH